MPKRRAKEEILEIIRQELPYLREKYGVVKIGIFGSVAKGTAKETSDIDILVELQELSGLKFIALADYLEEVLGRKIDIATFDCWRRSFANPRYRPIAEDVERNLLYVQ